TRTAAAPRARRGVHGGGSGGGTPDIAQGSRDRVDGHGTLLHGRAHRGPPGPAGRGRGRTTDHRDGGRGAAGRGPEHTSATSRERPGGRSGAAPVLHGDPARPMRSGVSATSPG